MFNISTQMGLEKDIQLKALNLNKCSLLVTVNNENGSINFDYKGAIRTEGSANSYLVISLFDLVFSGINFGHSS